MIDLHRCEVEVYRLTSVHELIAGDTTRIVPAIHPATGERFEAVVHDKKIVRFVDPDDDIAWICARIGRTGWRASVEAVPAAAGISGVTHVDERVVELETI